MTFIVTTPDGSQSQCDRHEAKPSVQQAQGAPHQTWRSLGELAEGIVAKAAEALHRKQLSSSPSIVPDESTDLPTAPRSHAPDWRDEAYCVEHLNPPPVTQDDLNRWCSDDRRYYLLPTRDRHFIEALVLWPKPLSSEEHTRLCEIREKLERGAAA
jgi:hypothetical protein